MTFTARTVALVVSVLVVSVLATAAALAWTTHQALLAEQREEGLLLAGLLARTAEFATAVADSAEGAIADQMVVEATIAAHMVAMAEAAKIPAAQIIERLIAITRGTVLDEFWITDEHGRAYLRNRTDVDFTFSPDARAQPQAHAFWPLLDGTKRTVVQEARRREIDDAVFKYVGVRGVDKPRIVQVGYRAGFIDQLRRRVGLRRLVDKLLEDRHVVAVQVVDEKLTTIALSAVPDRRAAATLGAVEQARLRVAVGEGRADTVVGNRMVTVIAPMHSGTGAVIGAALVRLPVDGYVAALRHNLRVAAVVAVVVVLLGAAVAGVLARRVTEPVNRLSAVAAAMAADRFELEPLAAVASRTDELGQLGRVFESMARAVAEREARLRAQVRELRIEIDTARQARHVAEITETEYFQDLRRRARALRGGAEA